ncbi:MAG: oligosaccharide repeat unit polymerase [Thermoproteota archaeon]
MTSLYGLADAPPAFIYAATGSFAVLLVVTSSLPSVRFPRPDCNLLAIGILLLAGISAYVYGMLLLSGGFRRLSFDLLSVYEVRAEFTKTMAPFMGYFVPWQATVINIVLLCYGLYKKRRWLIALACVAQLLIFGMTGHKSFLLAPMLAGGVYFIWRTKNVLSYIFGGATLLALAAYLLFLISGNLLAPAILVHRLFFVPAGLHLIYYDFFSQPEHPLVMLSNSILAPFVPYPYEVPIMWVISRAYWGRDFSPNVGYLGDAYAHFGFMGMFLFSIVLGVFLRVLDGAGSRLPSHLVAAIVAVPAMALTNAGLFTSLLTHGLIPTLVVIWLLRAAEARRNESARLTVRELVQVKSKTFL